MKKVEVTCVVCDNVFMRAAGEVRRSKRLGRRNFCSRTCLGSVAAENLPEPPEKGVVPESLMGMAGNKRDCYSPFRQHLLNMRRRDKRQNSKGLNLTLEDLKQIWESQDGRCPYTGWRLDNPPTTVRSPKHHPRRASVDRKDSTKGYTRDNVQFVALIAQYAKNRFTDEDLVSFCESVTTNKTSMTG